MKKNSKIKVGLGLFVALFIVMGAKMYSDKKIDQEISASQIEYENNKNKENEELKFKIESLSPEKNENQNLMDQLHYKALVEGKLNIAVIGSSVAAGFGASDVSKSWPALLNSSIRNENEDLSITTLSNFGIVGYSTQDIIDNEIISKNLTEYYNLVILEVLSLNDHGQSIDLKKTESNLNEIVSSIKEESPHAKIILTSPNPSSSKVGEVNEKGLSYEDYLNVAKKYAELNNLDYIDAYNGINSIVEARGLVLRGILSDGIHPNDEGYALWHEVIMDYFKK